MIAIFSFIISCATFAPALLLIAALRKRNRLTISQRSLVLMGLLGILTELAARYEVTYEGTNLQLLHIYVPLELITISSYFYFVLKGFIPNWLIPATAVSFVLFSIVNSIYIEPSQIYNSYARGLECLLIISWSIIGFYRIFTEMKVDRLVTSPEFWAYTGFLLYFATVLFIFIFSNQIMYLSKEYNYGIWGIHAVFVITLYLSLAIAISVGKKK